MLKHILTGLMLFLSLNSFACWKVEGSLAIDGETWNLNQKINHNQDYKFPMGTFILSLKIKPKKMEPHELIYKVEEKKGLNLVLVTEGKEDISVKKTNTIYAKGKEGQPHSIITLQLNDI